MINLKNKWLIASLLCGCTVGSVQALVLDTFDYEAALGFSVGDGDVVGNFVTESYVGVTETSPAGDVTYTMELLQADGSASDATTLFGGGSLIYEDGAGMDTELTLHYFDEDGASGIDFTDGGIASAFYFDALFADLGFTLDLTITSFDGLNFGSSTGMITTATNIDSYQRLFLSFASFIGDVDWTSVIDVVALINGPTASDLIITEVGTTSVPEPTTLAIFGLALVGFALGSKRKI